MTRSIIKRSRDVSVRSSDRSGRDRVVLGAALVGPSLLAIGWGVLVPSGGPAPASASQTHIVAMPTQGAGTPARTPTEDERAARAYCAELCTRDGALSSPSILPMTANDERADAPTSVNDGSASGGPLAPRAAITSIMRTPEGEPAIYADGAMYRAGDAFVDGWVVEAIDLPNRTVTLAHPEASEPLVIAPGR